MKAFSLGLNSAFGVPARGTGQPIDYVYLAELYPWQGATGVTYGTTMAFDTGPIDALPGDEEQPPGSIVPLYYSDRAYLTAMDDTDPRRLYQGRLQGFSVERRLPISPADGARAAATFGKLVLRNDDGVLDTLPDAFAVAGRRVVVKRLIQGEYLAHAVTIFDGVGVAWESDADTLSLTVRDKTALADLPLLPLYGGTGGKDGHPEWAGKPIHAVFGIARQRKLEWYDSVYWLSRPHFRRFDGIEGLWDKGGEFTYVGDFASEALLKAATLTPGTYATCKAEGIVRAQPAGKFDGDVTVDIRGDAEGGYISSHADIAKRILDIGGLTTVVDASSFASLATAYPDAAGFAWSSQITVGNAVSEVMGGIAAYWSDDREGYIVCGTLEQPDTAPELELTESDIIDLEPSTLPSSVDPVVWRVNINYARCHNVQNRNNLLPDADEDVKAFAEKEWRSATPATDTTLLARYPNAPELTVNSGFDEAGPAKNRAAELLSLYSPSRFTFAIKVTAAVASSLYHGKSIRITWPRHGLSNGRNFVVTALPEDVSDRIANVIVWG